MQINVRRGVSEVKMIMWLSVMRIKEKKRKELHLVGFTKVS